MQLLAPSAALVLGVCCALTPGCSSDTAGTGSNSNAAGAAPVVVSSEPVAPDAAEQQLAGGSCGIVASAATGLTQTHLTVCSAVDYLDNPPIGGDHYPVWAAFQSYSFAVPRGFWVHDLEHGAVVFSYNCPDGCSDEVATVQALIDALPEDPLCAGTGTPRRVVLTPDPLLDVRWGLSAWGHTLRAECVDADRFRDFYLNHFGLGPEALCNAGSDFGGAAPCR
ncbi:MAG: DUF3105 domain-containing protein [Polyangiaceae bacterium]